MKYSIKINPQYITYILIPIIISITLLNVLNPKMFTFKESIYFVLMLFIPFIMTGMLFLATFFSINKHGITIHYIGLIKKTITYDKITNIAETKNGFSLFALCEQKIRIDSINNSYLFSLKNHDKFLKEVHMYKENIYKN